MNRQTIIEEVVKIIRKYASPARIYLYGSHASGDMTRTSDIDIAYEDENFKDNFLIEEDVESLHTLFKIDIKNLAFKEDRFKNRVRDTGRVLFSATKKLRAEDGLLNFSKAFQRFENVVNRKEEFHSEGYGDIYIDLVVKRFEFTYEMGWKAIKRYLDFLGIDCKSPRGCFKEAFAVELIEDEEIWLDMIEMRNLSSHVYDEDEIRVILDKIDNFNNTFRKLKEKISELFYKDQV